MKVGIHQINYFPWLGYFDKVAKSDIFILLDDVQLTDSGMMQRNRVLNRNGEPSYITVAFDKKDYLKKPFMNIGLNSNVDWQKRQYNFLYDAYHKFSTWDEVYDLIKPIFEERYDSLQQVNLRALYIMCDVLEIDTSKFVFQSKIEYDKDGQKNNLVLNLCKAVDADIYLSGNGAKKYMDISIFEKEGIVVQFQKFNQPIYSQAYSKEFVSGLSILDVLFNCGIKETKELFWNNMTQE